MAKKSNRFRNPFKLKASSRNAGPMRDRRERRAKEKEEKVHEHSLVYYDFYVQEWTCECGHVFTEDEVKQRLR